ncbi:RnfABCDGE type electron transport complex subunit D, partial [Clostridioides difficile]
IYAVLAGLITTVIRMYGGYPEGVSYSILLVNCLAPLIDKFVRNRVFGEVAK